MSVTVAFTGAFGEGSTSVAASPGGTVTSAHRSLLIVGTKPDTATIATPTDWTHVVTHSGGTGAQGTDTGPGKIAVFVRDGAFSGAQTVSITNGNSSWALIVTFAKTLGAWSSLVTAVGTDTSATSNAYSATMTTTPAWVGGDLALGAFFVGTNAHTSVDSGAINATGITGGTTTELSEPETLTGNDSGGWVGVRSSTSGTASAAPTITATLTTATSGAQGPAVFVRLRDEAGGPVTVTGAAVLTAQTNLVAVAGNQTFAASVLTADTAVTPATFVTTTGAVLATADGSLTAVGGLGFLGASALSSETTLVATGQNTVLASVALSADTDLATSGLSTIPGSATLSSTGELLALGSMETLGISSLSGNTTLDVSGSLTVHASAVLTAEGTQAVTDSGTSVGTASLTAEGTLQGVPQVQVLGTSSQSGDGGLTATGEVHTPTEEVQGSASLAAEGSLASSGSLTVIGAGTLTAQSQAEAQGILDVLGVVSWAGNGGLTASAVDLELAVSGSVTLSAQSELFFEWDMAVTLVETEPISSSLASAKMSLRELEKRWSIGDIINL